MIYYQVNKKSDGISFKKISLIENELFTEKEVIKYNIPLQCVTKINIPKNKTFFNFGCRFKNRDF